MIDRTAWAEIDLNAFRTNILNIKKCLEPKVKICAVIKADAYGHGSVQLANSAINAGATYLAVAFAEEAVVLRNTGITCNIMILGRTTFESVYHTVAYNLEPFVTSKEDIILISDEAKKQNKNIKLHLKIDTGMTRLGIVPNKAGELTKLIFSCPNVELGGVCSHLADADSNSKDYTKYQLENFAVARKQVEAACQKFGKSFPLFHIANSAAAIFYPEAHFDMVRLGIAMYGGRCSVRKMPFTLLPVMTIKAIISQEHIIGKGTCVGYGMKFKADKETRIAVLPLGYADGVHRALSNKGYFCIEGESKKAPIVGNVCMDQLMIDVTDIPKAKIGTVATLFGKNATSASEIADIIGTIDYELLCAMSRRLHRLYVNGEEKNAN